MKFEYKIGLVYLLVGGLWILFSDRIVGMLFSDPQTILKIQTFKGWFYVLITGILFFFFLRHHLEKLRSAEARARESDRLKTNFIQNISHEIRTPMNGIIGFTELLKDKNLTETEKAEYLKVISESSSMLFNIVNDVLDISMIESGTQKIKAGRISLNELTDELFNAFNPAIREGIVFSSEKNATSGNDIIVSDILKVRQILSNLLSNSVKFVEKGYIKFGYILKEGEVEFYVEDSGIGISGEMKDKIFERFLKDDVGKSKLYDGVGLGLAICKGLVELLNGRIWLESEPGKGSRFSFSVPCLMPGDIQVPSAKGESRQITTQRPVRITVLIAEDNVPNQLYIREVLTRLGNDVLLASDGGQAVKMCREHNEIDLVLMDIKMPVLDGYEAIREIRKFRPGIYVIAQTAYALNEKEKALLAGFNDYLAKPFKAEQLTEAINHFKKERIQGS